MPEDELSPLRLLIIADDPLARAGLSLLLGQQPGCVIVGQLPPTADLPAAVEVYQPHVVIWDLGWELPPLALPPRPAAGDEGNGPADLDRLAILEEAAIPVVALLPDKTHAGEAWAAGARGLLLRQSSPEQVVSAARTVAQGLATLDPVFVETLRPLHHLEPNPPIEPLTARELQVLQLLAEGLPNKVIARRLNVSEHTIKFHVNAILSKLGAQGRTEAVVRATRLGLIVL